MAKGTRRFQIIVSILLGLTLLWITLLSIAFFYVTDAERARRTGERFGLYVCGIPVMFKNAANVLGDGTVTYDKAANRLIFNNARIECEGPAVYSKIDLTVELIGENKIVCTGQEGTIAVYASDMMLRKDLSFTGNGSLEIAVHDETGTHTVGIVADDLWIETDLSVSLSDAAESSAGIECSYLCLKNQANVHISPGSSQESTGIFTRGDICLEKNGQLHVAGAPSAKDSYGIQCTGVITAHEGSAICATSGGTRAGIVCYGTFVDRGAVIDSEIDAVNGVRTETSSEGN